MKEEYLKKINDLYFDINKLKNAEKPSRLVYNVREILELILKLDEIDNKVNYSRLYDDLAHTLDKEVDFVISAYDNSTKKNAAKVRYTEYKEELNNAIEQIHLDIYELLEK